MHQEYPKWVEHKDFKSKTVDSAEEHKALGDGWVDSPSHVGAVGSSYPKVVHHKKHPPKIAESEEAHAKLGPDYGYESEEKPVEKKILLKKEKAE